MKVYFIYRTICTSTESTGILWNHFKGEGGNQFSRGAGRTLHVEQLYLSMMRCVVDDCVVPWTAFQWSCQLLKLVRFKQKISPSRDLLALVSILNTTLLSNTVLCTVLVGCLCSNKLVVAQMMRTITWSIWLYYISHCMCTNVS